MSRSLFILVLLLTVLVCPQFVLAQEKSTADTPQNPNAALREKAFELLESVAGEVATLQSAENRARLNANIADSLWERDEKRARALFALAEEDIRAGLANIDFEDGKHWQTFKVFLKLRVDTVERIAKYDGELALAFLKATKFTGETQPLDVIESERGLELRLAQQMVKSSPELAVKLARKSLANGFSEEVLQLLKQLNKKHPEQALILYKETVKKLRDENFSEDWTIRSFARNLVQGFRPPTTDNATFRELIGLIITQALANGCGSRLKPEDDKAELCRFTATLLPQMERIDPRAAQLKRWIPQHDDVDIPPEAAYEFFALMEEEGAIDDLVAFAEKYPPIAQQIQAYAIRKASALGEFEQARKLTARLITDPGLKQILLDQIDGAQRANSFDEKKLEEMQSRVTRLPKDRERMRILLSYVDQLSGKNRDASLKFLKQASDIADTMKPGKEQAAVQIRIAMLYCAEKSERGFEIMESLMPKLNELVDAAAKLDGYETSYVRDGEWNMSAQGGVGALLTTLSDNAGHFARCDFERAVSVAAQFNRSEIRLMAQVKLAQSILVGPSKRKRNPFDYLY